MLMEEVREGGVTVWSWPPDSTEEAGQYLSSHPRKASHSRMHAATLLWKGEASLRQAEEADLAGQAEEAEGQSEEAGDVRWTDRHETEDGQTATERGR